MQDESNVLARKEEASFLEKHGGRVAQLMKYGLSKEAAVNRVRDEARAIAQGANAQPNAGNRIAVKRRGRVVQVMVEGSPRGLAIQHRSAQLARTTEQGLKHRLTKGWPGSLEDLLRAVAEETREKGRAHDAARALERKIAEAEQDLEQRREELAKLRG